MRMVSRTDTGRVRSVNEDRVFIRELEGGFALAIVADGMGGHQAGDIASQMAIDIIGRELEQNGGNAELAARTQLIERAIATANSRIFSVAAEMSQYHGMGTTVVVALAHGNDMSIGHIGDSRLYRFREGVLTQLTEDHSLVFELMKSGQISPEEAAVHPRRNVVTRALGTEPEVRADLKEIDLLENDYYLICSDGLTNMIQDDSISLILQSELDLDAKADKLVQEALLAGGDDNITLVLMQASGDEKRGDDQ